MFFIREGTHLYKFLMILACVGEYPVKAVHLLGYERVWKQKINEWHKYQIYCLPGTNEKVRAQLLSISGKTPYKTIRLHKSALPILEKVEPDAYNYYMKNYDAHHFSGAPTHVGRNHRLAEAVAMCLATGAEVLPWKVSDLQDPQTRYRNVDQPCFYLSRDLKEFHKGELEKTGYIRLVGALVYPQGMYAVYNTRDVPMQWRGRGEEKAQMMLSEIFRAGGLREESESAILFGKDFFTVAMTMADSFARRHLKDGLDRIYCHLHFIPMNTFGIKLLQIITTQRWERDLKEIIFGDAEPSVAFGGLEHDVFENGEYYYSHLDGDLCRLISFRRNLRKWSENRYVLACYPEQVPYIKEYLGDYWDKENLRVELYNLDALHAYWFEEEKEENK